MSTFKNYKYLRCLFPVNKLIFKCGHSATSGLTRGLASVPKAQIKQKKAPPMPSTPTREQTAAMFARLREQFQAHPKKAEITHDEQKEFNNKVSQLLHTPEELVTHIQISRASPNAETMKLLLRESLTNPNFLPPTQIMDILFRCNYTVPLSQGFFWCIMDGSVSSVPLSKILSMLEDCGCDEDTEVLLALLTKHSMSFDEMMSTLKKLDSSKNESLSSNLYLQIITNACESSFNADELYLIHEQLAKQIDLSDFSLSSFAPILRFWAIEGEIEYCKDVLETLDVQVSGMSTKQDILALLQDVPTLVPAGFSENLEHLLHTNTIEEFREILSQFKSAFDAPPRILIRLVKKLKQLDPNLRYPEIFEELESLGWSPSPTGLSDTLQNISRDVEMFVGLLNHVTVSDLVIDPSFYKTYPIQKMGNIILRSNSPEDILSVYEHYVTCFPVGEERLRDLKYMTITFFSAVKKDIRLLLEMAKRAHRHGLFLNPKTKAYVLKALKSSPGFKVDDILDLCNDYPEILPPLLLVFSERDHLEEALQICEHLESNNELIQHLSTTGFASLIRCCVRVAKKREFHKKEDPLPTSPLELISKMEKCSIIPDTRLYNAFIYYHASVGDHTNMMKSFMNILRFGMEPDKQTLEFMLEPLGKLNYVHVIARVLSCSQNVKMHPKLFISIINGWKRDLDDESIRHLLLLILKSNTGCEDWIKLSRKYMYSKSTNTRQSPDSRHDRNTKSQPSRSDGHMMKSESTQQPIDEDRSFNVGPVLSRNLS